MLIHPWDAGLSTEEWATFVKAQGFGHLVAAGRGRDVPVVVPTQFVLATPSLVLLHLARPSPIWAALEENPAVVLSVAGDWAYVPAAWKAVGDEDPRLGVPTTYYAAVQLIARATVVDDPDGKAEILRLQVSATEPGSGVLVDPASRARVLPGLRGLRLEVVEVRAKFKYGGNVDRPHREAVIAKLRARGGPADLLAAAHAERRLGIS